MTRTPLLVWRLGLVNAALLADSALNIAVCLTVYLVVNILHLYPSATAVCSLFLHMPPITTTETVPSMASYCPDPALQT
jgi:predicted membrane-bound spermidine synthase